MKHKNEASYFYLGIITFLLKVLNGHMASPNNGANAKTRRAVG